VEQNKKDKKKKPSFVFPFVLLALVIVGVTAAAIFVKPTPKEKKREKPTMAMEVDALLIGLLQEDDWVDRDILVQELRKLTGMYFEYHPESIEEKRREALVRWEKWWTGVT